MDQKQKEKEIDYQLTKMLIYTLLDKNFISKEDASKMLNMAKEEFSTITGAVDTI